MDQLRKNIIALGSETGKEWLNSLPELVSFFSQKWQLTKLTPFQNLSYNYVLAGYQHNSDLPIVLKLGFSTQEIQREAAALTRYNGNGCVKLLEHDITKGALLLECVRPGTSLKRLFPQNDDQATHYAINVMKQLHAQPITNAEIFPTLQTHIQSLYKENSNNSLPNQHLQKAQKLATDLLQPQVPQVLLHGDLHHDNILSNNNDDWIAIDPKGVIGDPAYEPGAFIINPIQNPTLQSNMKKIIERRIDQFASLLTCDKQRIKNWAYVHAVVSACWSLEDATSWQYGIAYAEIIDTIKI